MHILGLFFHSLDVNQKDLLDGMEKFVDQRQFFLVTTQNFLDQGLITPVMQQCRVESVGAAYEITKEESQELKGSSFCGLTVL